MNQCGSTLVSTKKPCSPARTTKTSSTRRPVNAATPICFKLGSSLSRLNSRSHHHPRLRCRRARRPSLWMCRAISKLHGGSTQSEIRTFQVNCTGEKSSISLPATSLLVIASTIDLCLSSKYTQRLPPRRKVCQCFS